MNRLTTQQRSAVIASLVKGNSIRATCHMNCVSRNTVTKFPSDMGLVCSIRVDHVVRNLNCERVQCNEIWAFVGSKQTNVPADRHGEWGDVWTRVAIDADTKLVPAYPVGTRDMEAAHTPCKTSPSV